MNSLLILTRQATRDLFRERILYNVVLVGFFLLFVGYLASLLVFGRQDRVMLHVGTLVNALCVYVVGVGAGSRLLRNELEQRTLTLTLVRPVSRAAIFVSRWLGISIFLGLNLFLLMGVLALGLKFTLGQVHLEFFQSFSLIWVESTYLAALALTLSLFLRSGMSSMICLAYVFLSHNHEQLAFLKTQGGNQKVLNLFESLTPDGSVFLMDTRVFYEQPLQSLEWCQRMGYGFLWALFFLLIGNAIFSRKNI